METWVNGRATNLRNYRMTANQIKDPCEVSGHEFKAPSILDWEFFYPSIHAHRCRCVEWRE